MEAAVIAKPVPAAVKRLLFGLTLILLCISAGGYSYWKTHPPFQLSSSASPEQIYYKQLVYAVNEMHNQVVDYDALHRQGKLSPAQIDKGRVYIASLMSSLTSPPEELSVAQYITEKLYLSYRQYTEDMKMGSPEQKSSYKLAENNYALFRQNAQLIKILSAYSGVNIDCH